MEKIKTYLKERIITIQKAIEILPNNGFLRGELLAFESILRKLEDKNETRR